MRNDGSSGRSARERVPRGGDLLCEPLRRSRAPSRGRWSQGSEGLQHARELAPGHGVTLHRHGRRTRRSCLSQAPRTLARWLGSTGTAQVGESGFASGVPSPSAFSRSPRIRSALAPSRGSVSSPAAIKS